MATLVLESLTCVKKTGDAGSNDEVYINLATEGLTGKLPENSDYWEMSDGQTQAIDRTYEFVGTFTFDTGITPPGSPLEFTGEGGDYELTFTYAG